MCLKFLEDTFGGGSSSNDPTAIAQAAENARQAQINAGMQQIDQQFSQFNDQYYNDQSQAYSDYYDPQIDKQYNDARQALILKLGSSGIINSSEGARQLANLDLQYNQQKTAAANQAVSYGAQARTQVENARTQLVNELNATADPAAAAASSAGLVQSLATPPAFSPLGSLFASTAPAAATAVSTPSNLYSPSQFSGPSVGGGGGSSTIVN